MRKNPQQCQEKSQQPVGTIAESDRSFDAALPTAPSDTLYFHIYGGNCLTDNPQGAPHGHNTSISFNLRGLPLFIALPKEES